MKNKGNLFPRDGKFTTAKDHSQEINAAFEITSEVMKNFKCVCQENGAPIKDLSMKVLADGNTRIHVSYRR